MAGGPRLIRLADAGHQLHGHHHVGTQPYVHWTLQKDADLKTFREWFRIDVHSVVVDVADDDIEGVEL